MALNKKREAGLEALILKAAAEVQQLNPHIGAPPPSYTDQECDEIEQGDEALAKLWESPEGQEAQQLGYSAADIIIADRGE